MSYCVQCGVQLSNDLKACPLCKTPVNNPNLKPTEPAASEHPERIEERFTRLDVGYARQLSIILTMIPIFIVLVLDILDGGVTWSPFVIGALIMLWCFLAAPLIIHQRSPYLFVALDVLALCAYLALIAWMTNGFSWYLEIVLPLLVLIGVTTLLMLLVIRRLEMLKLYRAALVVLLLALFVVGLEVIIDLSRDGAVHLGWSVYAGIPLAVIALVDFALKQNKGLKEEIRKRLFLYGENVCAVPCQDRYNMIRC